MTARFETEEPAMAVDATMAGDAETNVSTPVSFSIVAQRYTPSIIERLARCYEYILSDAWGGENVPVVDAQASSEGSGDE